MMLLNTTKFSIGGIYTILYSFQKLKAYTQRNYFLYIPHFSQLDS